MSIEQAYDHKRILSNLLLGFDNLTFRTTQEPRCIHAGRRASPGVFGRCYPTAFIKPPLISRVNTAVNPACHGAGLDGSLRAMAPATTSAAFLRSALRVAVIIRRGACA